MYLDSKLIGKVAYLHFCRVLFKSCSGSITNLNPRDVEVKQMCEYHNSQLFIFISFIFSRILHVQPNHCHSPVYENNL